LFEERIRNLKEKTEIVILPEMFSTGFSMQAKKLAETMEGPAVNWMKKLSAERKIVLTGSLIIGKKAIIITGWYGCCQTDNMDVTTNAICLPMATKTSIIRLATND
jgi:predicted amidohydrolase